MIRKKEEEETTEDSSVEKKEETPVIGKPKTVEFVALKTTEIYCNKSFKLIEGQKLPTDFPKGFITSLINSKIIKEV